MCWGPFAPRKPIDNSALIAQQAAERDRIARENRVKQDESEAAIRQGQTSIDDAFAGFDDSFYDTRRQSFIDFQLPDLERNFGDAQDDLTFALARSGKLGGTTAADRRADLIETLERGRGSIGADADAFVDQQRGNIELSRSDLTNNLRATGDPGLASSAAISRASSFSAAPRFSPIANLFANVASGIGQQANLERRGRSRYDTGLFSSGPSSRIIS